MNLKKIRQLLDLILEYWGQMIGGLLGLIALIMAMAGVITDDVFWKWMAAIFVVSTLPKRIKNNKDEDVPTR
jgi:hypothetical protein